MKLPHDYAERAYAGVLGKIIGVYVGRPIEGQPYERIMEWLGEIEYYVNEIVEGKAPIVVTDDDITGTFTFLRALEDYGNSVDLTPRDIGQSWLNYIVENKAILWWGGLGNSTEHTAFIRLKNGIPAPKSGSMDLNGTIIAEQIGAQIFIDGWAMVAPGNPALAAELAGKAASVSHDGEAIYASQLLAAMEAAAFVEQDMNKILDIGLSFIPQDSVIAKMIADIREIHAKEPDWHKGFQEMKKVYNYENYGGNCHMVPNHGIIILALLYGNWDFSKTMLIVNTAGWDTDCNSGNVGCLVGIRNGVAGFHVDKDWRGPVADRLYLPTADGGRSITDAVIETDYVVNMGRALAGEEPIAYKDGARFHFEYEGSVQGFTMDAAMGTLQNVIGHSKLGNHSLEITFTEKGMASTPTFLLPSELSMEGYQLLASPSLYAGQSVRLGIEAANKFSGKVFIRTYNAGDQLDLIEGPELELAAGECLDIEWQIPDTKSQPIVDLGIMADSGTVYLDYLTWDGAPTVTFTRPFGANEPWEKPHVWRQAWVSSMDKWEEWAQEPYRLIQNEGRGMITRGTKDWKDYVVEADIKPWLIDQAGIAARFQGLKRYYALMITKDQKLTLTKVLDGETILAEVDFSWAEYTSYQLKLEVSGKMIKGFVNGKKLISVTDDDNPLPSGAVGYVVENGHINSQAMTVKPIQD
jgi:ADP-ribosylglycohydrolase